MKNEKSQQISKKDRDYLLKLARRTIETKSKDSVLKEVQEDQLSSLLTNERGCFVTLNLDNQLRGCIGYILPVMPLYKAIIENAYNAAFGDPRFHPVQTDEVSKLHIDISVLTVPRELVYKDLNDLMNKLTPLQDGVIIKKGIRSATFLPQVWEQLLDKKEFLLHLCLKAGLNITHFDNASIEVELYQAEVFEEKE
jgi:uncharacterized protein